MRGPLAQQETRRDACAPRGRDLGMHAAAAPPAGRCPCARAYKRRRPARWGVATPCRAPRAARAASRAASRARAQGWRWRRTRTDRCRRRVCARQLATVWRRWRGTARRMTAGL
eukprot:scaffold241_cov229-Prasinococcus_capsulatus_cf.AAC.11